MAETMRLQVIEPDGEFFDGEVTMVELNTANGQMGIYPHHIPLTVAVEPGVLKIHQGNEVKLATLMSGFIQVLPEKMTIMSEISEWPDEIDGQRANAARLRAEKRLTEGNPTTDIVRAKAALSRALVRLQLAKEIKH